MNGKIIHFKGWSASEVFLNVRAKLKAAYVYDTSTAIATL